MDVVEIPFNAFVGIKCVEVAGQSTIMLLPDKQHLNHVGTVHAGVLFAVAEASAGQTLVDLFPDFINTMVPVLRSASIKYRKPAVANLTLTGGGSVSDVKVSEFRQTVSHRGRALLEVETVVSQNDEMVFRGVFTFFASLRPQE